MDSITWTIAVIFLTAALVLELFVIQTQDKVLRDQREYINSGCNGRYQGAGS